MTTIKLHRGTAADWTANNPTLAEGEPGVETDTRKWKVGDGETAWNSLPYFNPSTGGSGGSDLVDVASSPMRCWDWAIDAAGQISPRDITGGRLHAQWGTGDVAISGTRFTPDDHERLIHPQTEDEDPPDFLGASATPVDWTSSDTWFISASWRSFDPWHTGTYPQSLGCVQGGNGTGPDELIELALGISADGKIRITGNGLSNNDFGSPGQFNPAGGVEVGALLEVDGSDLTITAYDKSSGAWLQIGDPATITATLVNDSFTEEIHKFATGYGKGLFSYCSLATAIGGTPVRLFSAADAVANDVGPGDTWTGAVDGVEWLLGDGLTSDPQRIPAVYATERACWLLGFSGTASLDAPVPDPDGGPCTIYAGWTPRSGGSDDALVPLGRRGPALTLADGVWRFHLVAPLPDGSLLAADSGAFGSSTDGAGSLDPLTITTIPGTGVTTYLIDPGDNPDRDLTVDATAGLVSLATCVAGDFSTGIIVSFDGESSFVILENPLSPTPIASGAYTPGSRIGVRISDGTVIVTADGIVAASVATTTPASGWSGVQVYDTGAVVTDLELRVADTIEHTNVELGELADGTEHRLVAIIDDGTLRVRIDGVDVEDPPTPPTGFAVPDGILFSPTVHQDLHAFGIDLSAAPDAEIAALEAQ